MALLIILSAKFGVPVKLEPYAPKLAPRTAKNLSKPLKVGLIFSAAISAILSSIFFVSLSASSANFLYNTSASNAVGGLLSAIALITLLK